VRVAAATLGLPRIESMTDRTDSLGQKTALIVEDQALMRRTMRELLQDAFPDCNFLDVADGASALEACNAYRPVLVLMDISLPDADGIELTARLKILYPGIQVIIISYRSGEVYVQRALAAGARAYLVKDNLSTELIPAVAAAIGIPQATDRGAS
jgi:DNA-binding NarL/FixJ family response regulator